MVKLNGHGVFCHGAVYNPWGLLSADDGIQAGVWK